MTRIVLMMLALAPAATAVRSVCGTEELLPIGFTEEELARLNEIGTYVAATPPPPAGTRNPGEFEPMTGVLIRWPMDLPYSFIVDASNHVTVWVICTSSQQASVVSAFTAAGVNMSNVDFVLTASNSIWVRDYGPWFLMLPDGSCGIFDFDYNRPRPDDDAVPGVIGTQWGIPVYSSDIVHTGGNYMSTGLGQSMSTNLVIDENGGNEDWVDSQMSLYCGVDDYFTMEDPQASYIDHIDCWAKMLSPDRILVLQVPPGNPDYAALEAMADLFEASECPWGTNWQVFRVFSGGTEGYTNSIIINDRVYMPTWNTSNDSPAIAAYQAAMPGYTIVGTYHGTWLNTDAIHCRAMGVTDPEMLWIDHTPVASPQPAGSPVQVSAFIRAFPGNALQLHDLYYRTGTSGPFTKITMTSSGSNTFTASIPGQAAGATVQYYIQATDDSGRDERHPHYAPVTWCHQYVTSTTGFEHEGEVAPGFIVSSPVPNPFASCVRFGVAAPEGAPVTAAVWDLAGRLVCRLYEGEGSGVSDLISWTPGLEVPSGVYLVAVTAGDAAWSDRVTFVR